MSTFRTNKKLIRAWFQNNSINESNYLPPELINIPEMEVINALFACLPQEKSISDKASLALGISIAKLFEKDREQAQICMRRFMWHMNEESGNIGWGIPVAFAQSLSHSDGLTKIYGNVLLSYIHDKEGDCNYCDHAPLRLTCYEAVEIFVRAKPQYKEKAVQILENQHDDDEVCFAASQKLLQTLKQLS